MVKARTPGHTDAELAKLFDQLKAPRWALVDAGSHYKPNSPEYRALEHVRIAMDAAAELLTGRRDTFVRPEGPPPFGMGGPGR